MRPRGHAGYGNLKATSDEHSNTAHPYSSQVQSRHNSAGSSAVSPPEDNTPYENNSLWARPSTLSEEMSQASYETINESTWAPVVHVEPDQPTQTHRQSMNPPRDIPETHSDFLKGTRNMATWSALWNQPIVLWMLAVLYMACVAGLVILRHYSASHGGFFISEATSHYTWTYGPTAIIIMAASLWRQVDICYRVTAPWAELRKGSKAIPDLLRDDYISPLPHTILYRSFRARQITVLISTVGQILFRILVRTGLSLFLFFPNSLCMFNKNPLTVATELKVTLSTILLVMQTSAEQRTNMALSTRSFHTELLNESFPIHDLNGYKNTSFPNTNVYTFYANWTDFGNNDLPYGLMENVAFAPLLDPNISLPKYTMEGTVNAFIPFMHCQPLEVAIPSTINGNTKYSYSMQLSIQGGFCDSWPPIDVALVPDLLDESLPSREVHGWRTHFRCGTDSLNTSTATWTPKDWPWMNDVTTAIDIYTPEGYLFFVADYRYNKVANGPNHTDLTVSSDLGSNATLVIPTIQAISCKPSYSMARLNLSAEFEAFTSTPQQSLVTEPYDFGSQPSHEQNLSSADLVRAIEFSLEDVGNLFQSNGGGETYKNDTFIGFMGLAEGTSGFLEPLLDNDRLINASTRVFQALMAGVAWEVLLGNSSDTSTVVEISRPVDRLVVNEPVVWVMTGLFLVLGLSSAALALISTPEVSTAEPGSIGSLIAVLTHSPTLRKVAQLSSTTSHHNLNHGQNVDPQSVKTDHPANFHNSTSSKAAAANPVWWQPLSLKSWWICLSVLLACILIGVLEALQHISDSKSGFATATNPINEQILARLVPAALALILSALISSIDANILIFAPFAALRQKIRSSEILSNNLLTRPTPIALYYSIKLRYWGTLFTTLAVIIGTFLPVPISGLYVLEVVPYEMPISASRKDFFNMTSVANGQGEASAVLSLIERQNHSYPSNTYDGIALPSLSFDSYDQNFTGPVTITMPVFRAMLECDILPTDTFQVGYEYYPTFSTSPVEVSIPINVTWTCENNSRIYANYPDVQGSFPAVKEMANTSDGMYWGQIFSLDYSCASFIFAFGHVAWPCGDVNKTDSCYDTSSHNMTVALCNQQFQEVSAQVTYNDSALTTIDSKQPPVINSSSVSIVHGSDGNSSFPYKMEINLDSTFMAWDPINIDGNTPATQSQPFDAFFQIVTRGAGGVAPEQMLGPDNTDFLITRVLEVYRRYMALVINAQGRRPCGDGTEEAGAPAACGVALVGTATVSRMRVVQDRASKIALQVLLGLMALLSAAGVRLTRTRDVLRANPCSLAGSMSLVADSRMVDMHASFSRGLEETVTRKGMRSAMGRLGDGFALKLWAGRSPREQVYGVDTVETR